MQTENYKINLEIFEGPLDFLIHLIKKHDLNVYDIPIALILDQYLAYLELMKELDIDVAGEFILMAAELSHIKSKLLLYRDKKEEGEEEGPDPRADLVARLIEYQRYKRAAEWLGSKPMLHRDIFKRPKAKMPEDLKEEEVLEVEPFALLSAFQQILKRAPKEKVHEVELERISVTDRIYEIVELLKTTDDSLPFEELFAQNFTRPRVVVTFLALLEMARLKMIQVFQTDRYGPIRVKRKMETVC